MDLQRLTLDPERKLSAPNGGRPPRHKPGKKFLKGPIPWEWLTRAAEQPGKTLHVAIALWFLEGITRTRTLPLSGKVLTALGVNRHSGYRALASLENAGLVSVVRHAGRSPVVTILDPPEFSAPSHSTCVEDARRDSD